MPIIALVPKAFKSRGAQRQDELKKIPSGVGGLDLTSMSDSCQTFEKIN